MDATPVFVAGGGELPPGFMEIVNAASRAAGVAPPKSNILPLPDTPPAPKVERPPYGVVENRGLPKGMEPHQVTPGEQDQARINYADNEMVFTRLPFILKDGIRMDAPGDDGCAECMISGSLKRKILSTPGFCTVTPKPARKTYTIKDAPGKGLGMFATRDIRAGELIVAERPLMIVPVASQRTRHIPEHYTQAQRMQIILADSEKLFEVLLDRMVPRYKEAYMALADSHQHDGSGPVLGRIRTNGFAGEGMHDRDGSMDSHCYTIICNDLSRMNHSCMPNISRYWDMQSFSMQARAIRDIQNGEEITTSYDGIMISTAARQEMLAPYGVKCTCWSCINPEASHFLISRCFIVKDQLAPRVQRRGWYTDFSVPRPNILWSFAGHLIAHVWAGLEVWEGYAYTLFVLMKIYAALGDVEITKTYARRYSQWHLAQDGKAVDEKQVAAAFGMVAVAESVLRRRGSAKGKTA